MQNASKLTPQERRSLIVTAAVDLANEHGLSEVTFEKVAANCRLPTTKRTVTHYFKIRELRLAVVADERANERVREDGRAIGITT